MAEQPQYVVEQALKDCLEDMKKLRKQMSRNLPAQAVPPLAKALVKLRAESLWLRDELAEAERPTTTAQTNPPTPPQKPRPLTTPAIRANRGRKKHRQMPGCLNTAPKRKAVPNDHGNQTYNGSETEPWRCPATRGWRRTRGPHVARRYRYAAAVPARLHGVRGRRRRAAHDGADR